MVVAMDADVRADILRLAGPEFQQYYARKVAVLTDFSGGSAVVLAPASDCFRWLQETCPQWPWLMGLAKAKAKGSTCHLTSHQRNVCTMPASCALAFFSGSWIVTATIKVIRPHRDLGQCQGIVLRSQQQMS